LNQNEKTKTEKLRRNSLGDSPSRQSREGVSEATEGRICDVICDVNVYTMWVP